MKKSLIKNLSLQTFLQILNTIIPLITTPYVSRKIGAPGLGRFSYATSVAAYFTLFAMLGTLNYGVRSIAEVRDDMHARSKRFIEIYFMQVVTVLLASLAYGCFLVVNKDDRVIFALQLITLIGYLFDISWFFQGIEEFRITVSVSMVIRILSLAAIFIFVNSPDDLYIYTIIMLGSAVLWQGGLWFFLRGKVIFDPIKPADVLKHIKPNVVLFIPLIAMTIFHYMDKTMLGLLSTDEQSGYYYNVDKIITIPLGIFTGIGTVMLPKMTFLFRSDEKKARILLGQSVEGVLAVAVPMSLGILAVADDFIPLFLGEEFSACIFLTKVLAPVLIVKGLSNALRAHYLIPAEKERVYILSVVVGVVINICCNYILIPKYDALGAEMATILAEISVLLVELLMISDVISIPGLIKQIIIYVLLGIIMLLTIRFSGMKIESLYIRLVVEMLTGVVVYSGLALLIWKITGNMLYNEMIGHLKRLLLKGRKDEFK